MCYTLPHMARRKLSEYKAKQILHSALDLQYTGIQINTKKFDSTDLEKNKRYVVKVDQGVKGRMKRGLVKVNANADEVKEEIKRMEQLGYSQFIVEEFIPHNATLDLFLSLERIREGIVVNYSNVGGINVESNVDKVQKDVYNSEIDVKISSYLTLPEKFLKTLVDVFEKKYFSFLEINPLLILNEKTYVLDLAVEVDDAAEFFVHGAWSKEDYTDGSRTDKTQEEKNIEALAEGSPASLKLTVFNPQGEIFLLLSGGGASIALADEVYNRGYGKELANYGEYSGNPNNEETYTYTRNVLSLLLKSTAGKKVLIIAGGVANFTDIRKTFKGVIKALNEVADTLREQHVKVYVRRGGPYQKEGLSAMKVFLEKEGLYGYVAGPEMICTNIVKEALLYTSS